MTPFLSGLILPRRRYTPWNADDVDREVNLDPDHPVAAQDPYEGNIPAPGLLLSELLGDEGPHAS